MLHVKQIACASILSVGQVSVAAANAPASEDSFFADIPVMVTATRLSQPREDSPVSTTIIDKEMIEAYGAVNLIDVLRLVPGIQVVHPSGERLSLTYHGEGSEFASRMQVLIDGRSVYSPILGHVEWNLIPVNIEDISHIEVTRGPNAASYGANSFSAVINIITEHPGLRPGQRFTAENGEGGYKRYYLSHSEQLKDFSYRISASHRQDNGFDTLEFPDDKAIRSFHFSTEYQFNVDTTLEFQAGYNQMFHEEGDAIPADDRFLDPLRDITREHSFQLLRWTHNKSVDEQFKIQFYHNREIVDDDYTTASLTTLGFGGLAAVDFDGDTVVPDVDVSLGVPIPVSTYTSRYDLELEHSFSPAKDWRVVWGGSLRRDESGSAGYFFTGSDHDTFRNDVYRLFGHAEWKPSASWTFNFGALAERTDITTGIRLSPRLAANYHYSPRHTFRLSANRAFRTPSVFEEFVNFTSRSAEGFALQNVILTEGGIKPEKITTFELAWLANIPEYQGHFEAKLFHERIKDRISDVEDNDYTDHPLNNVTGLTIFDDVFLYQNEGSSTANGLELQLSLRPTPYNRLHLGYTYIKKRGIVLEEFDHPSRPDRFDDLSDHAPRTSTTVQYIHDFEPGLRGSLSWHRYGLYEFSGGDDTGDFSIVNFRLAKSFKYANGNYELAANFQNVGDDYFDYEREQAFDNAIHLTFKASFN